MRVRLLYFGILRELPLPVGELAELPEGTSVAALLRLLRAQASNPSAGDKAGEAMEIPIEDRLWQSLAVAVNREYASAATLLHDGDEVALLPPVSGGAPASPDVPIPRIAIRKVEITDAPIPAEAIVAALKAPADGAVCVFDGIVRDNTRGRPTLYLDYEAYREMALAQMHTLAAEAVARFGVRDVAIVHRLGRLAVGDTSVLIAVASAHRAAAFDACRFLIDTLKKTVPIWKKETFADGSIWADGEPFPESIALHPTPEPQSPLG